MCQPYRAFIWLEPHLQHKSIKCSGHTMPVTTPFSSKYLAEHERKKRHYTTVILKQQIQGVILIKKNTQPHTSEADIEQGRGLLSTQRTACFPCWAQSLVEPVENCSLFTLSCSWATGETECCPQVKLTNCSLLGPICLRWEPELLFACVH